MTKFAVRVILFTLIIFELSAGNAVCVNLPRSKEELDFEFQPPLARDVGSESESPAAYAQQNVSAENEPETAQPAPEEEALSKKTDIGKAKAPPMPSPAAVPPPVQRPLPITPSKKTAGMPTRVIEARPIKVEEKEPELARPSEVKIAVERKEIIAPIVPIGKIAEAPGKSSGILNRWFGLETGLERIGDHRPIDPKAGLGLSPGEIYTLKDCITIAIKNDIQLRVAEKSVKLARMRVMEARRNMLPSFTVVFEPYTGKVNDRNYIGRKQYVEGKQPIFRGGELYFTLRQAETNLEVTKMDSSKIKNELILQVKKAYYSLAKAMDNLKLQEELSAETNRIYKMVNDQYEAKVASKIELLNVSSQTSQIKYQLASAEGDVSVAELILKQAMNVNPDVKAEIKPNLSFNRTEVDYEKTLKMAFLNRPEIKINQLMLEYYNYGKKVAFAKMLPKVDLMGSWGLAKEYYSPIDNAWGNTGLNNGGVFAYPDQKFQEQWYGGIKASLPIWGSTVEYSYTREQWTPVISAYQGTEAATNSFKFKLFDNLAMFSDKMLSEVDFDKARQELNKIRQDVTLEVKEQCFNYQKALIQLDTASSKVKYQESDFELVKMRRGLDEVQDSGVIESMIKLSQEKFGYVQALSDCHIAIASINKAVGIEDYIKDE